MDSLAKADLLILNLDGSSHLNSSNNKTSNIDLIIAKAEDALFADLEVFDELFESDHFPIKITLSLSKYVYRKKSFRVRSTKTNWDVVSQMLEDRHTEFFDLSYVSAPASQKYEIFVEIVKSSIKKNTPKKRIVADEIYRNPVEWWDEECAKLKRLRRAAYKKWRFTKTLDDKVLYRKSCAVLKRAIKRKKKGLLCNFH